jgi:hypothetical protein
MQGVVLEQHEAIVFSKASLIDLRPRIAIIRILSENDVKYFLEITT